jgi:hypothetical protein
MSGVEAMVSLSVEDRLAVTELISLHGHLIDAGAMDRFHELFTADVVYDVSHLGGGQLVGIDAIRDAGLALGADNPVAHHVTNIVINRIDNDHVHAWSKGIGVRTDGTVGSVVYKDIVVRTPAGWRISHRAVLSRRIPLSEL